MLDGFAESKVLDRLKWAAALLLVLFLAAPSFIVIPMSFSSSDFLEFPPPGLSLRWYAYFWESITWTHAARAWLIAGVLTDMISVPIGVLAAYGTHEPQGMGTQAKVLLAIGAFIALGMWAWSKLQ